MADEPPNRCNQELDELSHCLAENDQMADEATNQCNQELDELSQRLAE